MQTGYGHLTYCSNIHPGVSWDEHFRELQESVPYVRAQVAGERPMALGLRCANEASLELEKPEKLREFRKWLGDNNLYVFTFNGFPYGNFHNSVVKDYVHAPDWTTGERADYTKRLFRILSGLLPEGMSGGVSTPPLSYRHWWEPGNSLEEATGRATRRMLEVVDFLIGLENETGQSMHLDVEPEPDGILDNGEDFFKWYLETLLPEGLAFLAERRGYSRDQAREAIFSHVQLCYDVCHFAISYESPGQVFERLRETGIRVGRIQVSSALQLDLTSRREEKLEAISAFHEPVYLHQVVARTNTGALLHFTDLDKALAAGTEDHREWRVHFHVPLFIASYGLLNATQHDIQEVLGLQKERLVTSCLEVETYTWSVLPPALQIPVSDSIARELTWVKQQLEATQHE